MLPKKERFTRSSFPKGRPTTRRSFSWGTVAFFEGSPRFSVVVSKKALKKAHERNRAKRRIYSLLQKLHPQHALVLHLRAEALTAPYTQIEQDLRSLVH